MNISAEKALKYLLRFMDEYIEQTLYSVLEDSMEYPEHSAVAASNLVKCYIKVCHECGFNCNCVTVKEYMLKNCFSTEEIELFEKKRRQEAVCYMGEQF